MSDKNNVKTVSPRVDVYETKEAVVLVADMPGVSAETINITLENSTLTILGEVAHTTPATDNPRHHEFNLPSYRRTFALSDALLGDDTHAEMENGVLKLTFLKAETARVRQIAINN